MQDLAYFITPAPPPFIVCIFFFLTVITIVVCTEVVTGSHFTLHNDTPPQHIQTRIYLFTFYGYFQS